MSWTNKLTVGTDGLPNSHDEEVSPARFHEAVAQLAAGIKSAPVVV